MLKITGIQKIMDERGDHPVVAYDVNVNSDGQLFAAARALLNYNEAPSNYIINNTCPKGWDEDRWAKMLNKPLEERMAIAASLLAAELDRREFERSNEIELTKLSESIKEYVKQYGIGVLTIRATADSITTKKGA